VTFKLLKTILRYFKIHARSKRVKLPFSKLLLKVEAIQYELDMTRDEMWQAVFEYIDYNRKRRHSVIGGYVSPFKFELN